MEGEMMVADGAHLYADAEIREIAESAHVLASVNDS